MTESRSKSLKEVLKEYRKAIFFLVRFLGVFGGLSFIYGLWVRHYAPQIDPATDFVAANMKWLNGDNLELRPISLVETKQAAITFFYNGRYTMDLFEGCNGVAVMILFFAFVMAFRSTWLKTSLFSVTGFFLIHLFNLGRLQLLMLLAANDKDSIWYGMFDFMHKYLFTLIIYGFVFLLWLYWIQFVVFKKKKEESNPLPVA